MSHDTWIHRGVRAAVVRPLARTPVTPNQITTLRLATGLAAAAALAVGTVGWRDAGAGLFLASALLDRVDGDLARFTGKTTPWGHTYDLISDAACNMLVLVGLGIGLRGGPFGLWALPMGVVAGAAVGVILWEVMRMEALGGPRTAELDGAAGFDPDDAIFAIPVALWLGWADGLLMAATVIAPAFAVFFYAYVRRRLAAPEGEQPPEAP
jgi:phosphatidylglycerophosphate synthase